MSTTWTTTGTRSVKATCTTGSEAAPANPVQATNTVAFVSAAAGNTVTVRGLTFTAIANGGTPADTTQFAVGTGGSADTDTGTAFAAAVNANAGRLGMTAVNASGTVTLTADEYGTYANAWSLAKVGDPITVGGATFSGGVDLVGAALSDVGSFAVFAEASSGQTVAAGSLACYVLNDITNVWARAVDRDLALDATAVRSQGFAGAEELLGRGRVAYLPDGVTVSSGSVVVYINCAASRTLTRSGGAL